MSEENSLDAFRALGLTETTLGALRKKGFEKPTDIQSACIPLLLEKEVDVVGQAQTGTGKTAAFALPILEKLDEGDRRTQALILTPTRELAMQVAEEIESLKGERKISVDAIYGGASYETQFRRLKAGLQIVVGTPGRIQDHLERGTLDISHLSFAVLDEADEMLDMGFVEDIEKILSQSNEDKRMLLFSATMPAPILSLAKTFMRDAEIVRIEGGNTVNSLTEQYYCFIKEAEKVEALMRIASFADDFYAIVFCRTKLQCEELGQKLYQRGFNAEALHGDLSQKQRELILQKMRDHKISILVATDVAARGIDINELTHVINYSVPEDSEVYTHRIGRTGRAGRTGVAITLVSPYEKRRFFPIQRTNKEKLQEYTIPTVDDLMKAKKARIAKQVIEAMHEDSFNYEEVANSLLSVCDPHTLVRSLLALHYGSELDRNQYSEIRSGGEDRKEKKEKREGKEGKRSSSESSRLFFAVGRKDHYTKRILANRIMDECHLRDDEIRDIEVMDNFSFVNVPSRYAERIIRAFRSQGNGGRPLATIARDEDGAKKDYSFKSGKKGGKSNAENSSFYGRDNWDDWKGPKRKKKKETLRSRGRKR